MLKYLLADHLGSTTLSTDANGTVSASALYKAFGELRSTPSALGTDYKFTGQREEASLGLYFFVSRFFDPYLNRFTQPDSIVPLASQGTQAWDRYAFVNNNPVRYNDPTGHQACNTMKNPNCDIYIPKFTGKGWTEEEMTAIIVAYTLAIRAFGGMDNFLDAFGGSLTFKRVADLGKTANGSNIVATGGSLTIKIDADAFAATGDKMTWYALHEIGHTFDKAYSGGNPKLYKSQAFVSAFNPGCITLPGVGCSGSAWHPNDTQTTGYGLTNSVEDFADSFASTILLMSGLGYPNSMSFTNVGLYRSSLIYGYLSYYSQ